jgi:hypothetical protein
MERITGVAQLDGIGYNPFDRSTFWRKFKARNPHYLHRAIRYISGYIENGQIEDSVTEHFIITGMSDPSERGNITIEGKDVLTLTQLGQALAPAPSIGSLDGAITSGSGSFDLAPSGVGAQYPASGFVRINDEVMSFTRASDTMTVTRGQYSTQAAAHDAGANVQLCLHFNAQLPYQILQTLLETYADIPTANLDIAQWIDESVTKNYLPSAYNALITEPTEVASLLDEITEQMYFYVWFNTRENKVKIRAVRPIADDEITRINFEEHIIKGSLSVSEENKSMVTRTVVNYAQRDPTKKLDEVTNYAASEISVNLEAESNFNIRRTKIIYSRWMNSGAGAQAQELGERMLNRFGKPLKTFSFSLDAKDRDLWLADFVSIKSPFVVDFIGNEKEVTAQVTRGEEQRAGSIFSYRAQEFIFQLPTPDNYYVLRRAGSGDKNIENRRVNLREWWDEIFPATPPQADFNILFIIETNVICWSNNTSFPAIEVLSTDFPTGCTITLQLNQGAYVVGRGGRGGDGTNGVGANGGNGGTALYTRFPINIANAGTIGGGGGGGSGGAGYVVNANGIIFGAGGGGGAGYGGKGESLGDNVHTGSFEPMGGSLSPDSENGNDGTLIYGAGGNNSGIKRTESGFTAFYKAGKGGRGGALGQVGIPASKLGFNTFPDGNSVRTWLNSDTQLNLGGIGGIAGNAIDGVSYVTWIERGDVRGNEVN